VSNHSVKATARAASGSVSLFFLIITLAAWFFLGMSDAGALFRSRPSRFWCGGLYLACMNLSSILSNISHDEVLHPRDHAKHPSRRGKPFAARSNGIMEKYPAIGVFLSLHATPGHALFTKEKLEGYTSACHLISTLAFWANRPQR